MYISIYTCMYIHIFHEIITFSLSFRITEVFFYSYHKSLFHIHENKNKIQQQQKQQIGK